MPRSPTRCTFHPATILGVVVFGGLLFLAGCAGRQSGNPFQGTLNTEPVILQATNQARYDVEIYIRPGGRRELLATLRSGGFQVYEFRWPSGVPLSMELEFVSGGRHRLPPFPFSGVERLVLTVATDITRSTLRR
mgnify:CR=1 FL=1